MIKGLIVGFSIAVPVGPISLLCIERTLVKGRLTGLVSGLGAATADAVYGSIGILGITAISAILINQIFWIRLIGGLFLLYLGTKIFLSQPTAKNGEKEKNNLAENYISTLLLTLTNPMTILSFAAIFAGISNLADSGNLLSGILFVAGVFLGSALWWLILSSTIGIIRKELSKEAATLINKASGLLIIGFGIIVLIQLFL